MTSKPTVTLTLAGDEKKLTDSFDRSEAAGNAFVSSVESDQAKLSAAFDKVGAASKAMGDKVKSSGKDFEPTSDAFDNMAERTDTAETRFTGFSDTIGGVTEGLSAWNDESLSTSERLQALGQAGADLAGGLTGFVVPAIQTVWQKLVATTAAQWALTTAQTAWNGVTTAGAAAMRLLNAAFVASPIGWVVLGIGALVTAFILLWNKSAAFRDFFIGVWNGIKSVVGGVVDWIVGAWNGLTGFLSKFATGVGDIFSGIGNAIKTAFKTAVNFVIDILNSVVGFFNKIIYGINLVNPFDDIPAIPKIPRLHSGGVVPGIPGQERLMVLQGGEEVNTSSQGSGGGSWTFAGDTDTAVAKLIMYLVSIGAIRLG